MSIQNEESTSKIAPEPKRSRLHGAARFRNACAGILRDQSDRIARAIADRACDGDVASARLLLRIIDDRPRRKRLQKKGLPPPPHAADRPSIPKSPDQKPLQRVSAPSSSLPIRPCGPTT